MVGIFRNGKGAVGHILGDREEGELSLVNGSISKREKDSLDIVQFVSRRPPAGWYSMLRFLFVLLLGPESGVPEYPSQYKNFLS